MTLPEERRNAVIWMGESAQKLFPYKARRKGQHTCHVPKEIVEEILRCLRHYPSKYHVEKGL